MTTKILFVGDVVGRPGCAGLLSRLSSIVHEREIDFVIVNGENAADGAGITPKIAGQLLQAGVDVITTGNHVWARREVFRFLDISDRIVRPANYPAERPGRGWTERTARNGEPVKVVNLSGCLFMDCAGTPFATIDELIAATMDGTRHIVVDMHAEATSEKMALGHYLAGRVTAVLGTHTHVQTADPVVLPGGTAYITDVGMTGPLDSVIGMSKDLVLHNQSGRRPQALRVAEGPVRLDYVIVSSDGGRAVAIERVQERLR